MFGNRAKALFVYLAVCFVLNERGKTEAAKTKQFGCSFDDDKYKKETNNPIWMSETHTPDSLIINSQSELHDLRSKIKEAFTKVMGNYPLNNVDQFIGFIRAYKNQTGNKTLEEFFNDYHVPFQPHEDPVSFLVEINSQLAKLNSSAMNHMYIVSAYVDPQESFWNDKVYNHVDNETFSSEYDKIARIKLTEYRFQRHIAGVIKIKIHEYGRLSGERGIILLDPGYMDGNIRVNPYSVVLMENKQMVADGVGVYAFENKTSEVGVYVFENETSKVGLCAFENKTSKYKLNLRNKFALVSEKDPYGRKVLYLRDKPFCSFMDSTTKGNLLGPNYGIWSFNHDGSPKGYLTFILLPENTTYSSPYFRFGHFNKTTEGFEYLEKEFPFDYIKADNISQDFDKKDFDIRAFYMGLNGDTLLTKLQTIQSEVFANSDLVWKIYKLRKNLEYQKIIRESKRQKARKLFQGSSCFGG